MVSTLLLVTHVTEFLYYESLLLVSHFVFVMSTLLMMIKIFHHSFMTEGPYPTVRTFSISTLLR